MSILYDPFILLFDPLFEVSHGIPFFRIRAWPKWPVLPASSSGFSAARQRRFTCKRSEDLSDLLVEYPPAIKHGSLEYGPLIYVIFPFKPPSIGDVPFPCSVIFGDFPIDTPVVGVDWKNCHVGASRRVMITAD